MLYCKCSNLFGGQNLTENPIKALWLSLQEQAQFQGFTYVLGPLEIKNLCPSGSSSHLLSTLNLRNAWQPTSTCENYVTNKFQESIRTPFDGVA